MIEKLASVKKQLSELATVLNEFKSEAVQLRILDLVLGTEPFEGIANPQEQDNTARRARVRPMGKMRKKIKVVTAGKPKNAPAGTGAVATLTQLLSGNFFDRPRTINDIVEHCKHNLARTFKANEFSGKLARMVRNGTLTRKKNADKQYEYKKS